MQFVLLAVAILASALLAVVLALGSPFAPRGGGAVSVHATVERVQAIAEIAAVKIQVGEIIEVKRNGMLFDLRMLFIAKGEAKVGIRGGDILGIDADQAAKVATVRLREPVVLDHRIDHARSSVHSVAGFGYSAAEIAEAQAEAFRIGQGRVLIAARDADHRELAKRQLQQLIGGFYEALGWSCRLRWVAE